MINTSYINRLPGKYNKENAHMNANHSSSYSTVGGHSQINSNALKPLVKGKPSGGFEAQGKIRKGLTVDDLKESNEVSEASA